ncbi:TrmH family RNA methyltransferase [Oryzihumus leptocrescens]|uniref:TrmH family RNA methyltransferase n=1 Tax=Oryzihumus leptocrescens TaxID=297536 RepID=A0A542ZKG1_9MICO|nr:RNA methyltransferase [Oryzihumus leptocrescens]TQL60826.1 TrmH family RNA methyltransferase [Oryzihumus leptocrescens]
MLTNTRSDRVRSVKALTRRAVRQREGLFLAEGPQAVREAVRFRPDVVRDLYAVPEAAVRHAAILAEAAGQGIHVHEVSPEVLAAMCDTTAPQGLLAVCRPVDAPLADVLGADPRLVVVLTNVRDPGNAGTVIRGADAAGADAVLVSDASVDVYNPKVVRSTVGSLFHLPVVTGVPVPQLLSSLREAGVRLLAADGSGTTVLDDADLSGRHAWVMGNEAWGLEPEVRDACDEVVRVPIHGHAESLNLAMAATICLYASASAHRGTGRNG